MTDSFDTPTIEQIHRHASVRSYKPDPVPPAVVEAIVASGQRASTSSNLQMWSVVAVSGAATRQTLADLCGQQEHIAQAPLFLAWCADLTRLERACELRGYSQEAGYLENFLVAAVDAAIAMQNAALAAESLGLGICYIGAIRNRPREVIDLLGLPPLVMPIAGMTVGWPAVEPQSSVRGCRWGSCCTGSATTPAARIRRWPTTTSPWPPPASMPAGRCRSLAGPVSWRTTAGPNILPVVYRRRIASICARWWRSRVLG
jgi:nitroreductase